MGKDEKNNDLYGFVHLTFQEYLAARYIAAQPDPEYIDLVMTHLHEAWWQQVHLLTIAHLGSGNVEASKASTLIMKILHVYRSPTWILRSSRSFWLRLIGPGKLLPQVQLERRIACIQAREFELAAEGYDECMPDGTTAKVRAVLSAQAASLVRHILYDEDRREEQKALLTVACQLLQRQGNEAVVSVLLEALHDADWDVRRQAAASLGRLAIKDTTQLRQVLVALNRYLHDADNDVRRAALVSIHQLLEGRPIPGYRWVPLQKRQTRSRSLKRIAILAGVVAFLLLVALTVTLLDPNSLIARWVTSLSIIVGIVSVIGVTLRDLWERKQSNQVQISNGD